MKDRNYEKSPEGLQEIRMTKTYPDKAVHLCAPGRRYEFTIYRRRASAGKEVMTFCPRCSKTFTIRAGIPKGD